MNAFQQLLDALCRQMLRNRRHNNPIRCRQRVDGHHTQRRRAINENIVVLMFVRLNHLFEYRFVVHDADQRHLHACQLDVGRQEIHPFLVMKHPFSMDDRSILYGFYHKIVQRNRQLVRLPAKA